MDYSLHHSGNGYKKLMKNNLLSPEHLQVSVLFKPGYSIAYEFLSQFTWPWEALPGIGGFILKLSTDLDKDEFIEHSDGVWIHKDAKVAHSAYIGKCVIIDADAEVRHGAFIRENALVGAGSVVGNSTELKNVILFNEVQVPHYNYVGDSILGYKSHMGAGSITSNLKNDQSLITVSVGGVRIET